MDGFRSYTEWIIPLLTCEQQEKQKLFAEHFVNHWSLPEEQKQKILLVNYDEKWFFGMVPRSHAKQCNAIGLFRHSKVAYHKNYINKVMLVAVTGYAFCNNIEHGGEGVKIALCCVQSAKMAKKTVQQATKDENGKVCFVRKDSLSWSTQP